MPWPVRAAAQARARRVGVLNPDVDPGGPPPGATAQWKKLGWIEGETLLVERKYAGWRMERMPELVDSLLHRHGAELLIANCPEAAAAAARATRTVPIVFNWGYLPIECGLIDSYARPGRNLTGAALFTGAEDTTKRGDFMRAIAPSARRVAVLVSDTAMSTISGKPLDVRAPLAAPSKSHGFEFTIHTARRVEDVEAALAEAAASHPQVIAVNGSSYIGAAKRVAEFALRERWPSTTFNWDLFTAGLLLYYGLSEGEADYMGTRIQEMADRILRGAKPADIPVELPRRYALVLNLKVARALGLTLPQSLLLQADQVIE